jgi:ABC-type multidrug transport system fused ATPase/permease subunit
MFDRFFTGFSAARSCWEILREDKKLVLFPLISGIACLIVVLSFFLPLAVIQPRALMALFDDDPRAAAGQVPWWFWVLLFAFYFCNYFVIYFFNAALIHCALFRFRGIPTSVNDGLWAATQRLPQILAWSFVSATVGLLLKAIENSHERAGELISSIAGTAWSIVTYFVMPVLIVEKVGPFEAIARSARILKSTWGEALGGRIGIRWFMLPFWLIGIVVGVGGFFLLGSALPLGVALLALAVVYLIVLALVNAALETILLSGLYLYATQGEVPAGMDRNVLKGAFAAK